MRDDFGALFAASAALRRDPTPAELLGGIPCGPFSQAFLNEMFFAESSVLAELAALAKGAGLAPDETLVGQIAQASARGLWVGQIAGTGDLAIATLGTTVPAILQGMRLAGVAPAANTTTTPKLRVVNVGTAGGAADFPILKEDGSAPAIGEIKAGGRYRYEADGAGNMLVSGGGMDTGGAVTVLNSRLIVGGVPRPYRTPGTYSLPVPKGVTLSLQCRSGGGGGGGCTNAASAGSGGGGGGLAIKVVTAREASVLTLVVGVGGAGGTGGAGNEGNGGNGGTTSVAVASGSFADVAGTVFSAGATVCAVTGGTAGGAGINNPQITTRGLPGIPSGGDDNISGDAGGFPIGVGGSIFGGSGGASPRSGASPTINNAARGNSSAAPGVGGNGDSAGQGGGAGSPGEIIVYM